MDPVIFTTTVSHNITRTDHAGYGFTPLFLTMAIISNIVTFCVLLCKPLRHMPISKILIALAIFDLCFNLLFPLNKPFIRKLLGVDIRALSHVGCKVFFGSFRFFKTCSSWMVVLLSCQRFVAVWFPVRAKTIDTNRNVTIAIVCIAGILAIYIGYWCSWADELIDGACIPNSQGSRSLIREFLIVGLLLYAFIPIAILLVLNILIVCKMFGKKNKNQIHTTEEHVQSQVNHNDDTYDKTTTVVLLCLSIVFVILVTPIASAHLVALILEKKIFQTTDPDIKIFREVAQIMEILNHSINCFVYALCSKVFRKKLAVIFCCKEDYSVDKHSGKDVPPVQITGF